MTTLLLLLAAWASSAPTLSARDLDAFPPKRETDAWVSAIKEHLDVADAYVLNAPNSPHALLRQWELRERLRAWKALQEAQNMRHNPYWCVMELMVLYDALGRDAYRRGEMPCPFPLHLYADITDAPPYRPLYEEEGPAAPVMVPLP